MATGIEVLIVNPMASNSVANALVTEESLHLRKPTKPHNLQTAKMQHEAIQNWNSVSKGPGQKKFGRIQTPLKNKTKL